MKLLSRCELENSKGTDSYATPIQVSDDALKLLLFLIIIIKAIQEEQMFLALAKNARE